jgi:hypothetical protein
VRVGGGCRAGDNEIKLTLRELDSEHLKPH